VVIHYGIVYRGYTTMNRTTGRIEIHASGEVSMVRAFLLGLWEFRRSFTTRFEQWDDAYDWGREWAHRLTFRRWDA
jgi:hypothetical protein